MAEGLECRSAPPQEATPDARSAPGTGLDEDLGGYGGDEEEEEEDLQQRRDRLCHAWRQQAKKAKDKALKEAVTARKRKREDKTDHIMEKLGPLLALAAEPAEEARLVAMDKEELLEYAKKRDQALRAAIPGLVTVLGELAGRLAADEDQLELLSFKHKVDQRDQYRSADVDLGKKTSEEVDVELLGVYQRKHQQEIFHFS